MKLSKEQNLKKIVKPFKKLLLGNFFHRLELYLFQIRTELIYAVKQLKIFPILIIARNIIVAMVTIATQHLHRVLQPGSLMSHHVLVNILVRLPVQLRDHLLQPQQEEHRQEEEVEQHHQETTTTSMRTTTTSSREYQATKTTPRQEDSSTTLMYISTTTQSTTSAQNVSSTTTQATIIPDGPSTTTQATTGPDSSSINTQATSIPDGLSTTTQTTAVPDTGRERLIRTRLIRSST